MTAEQDSKQLKVLVCEPEGTLTRQLIDYVRERGMQAELVRDGKNAKEMFDKLQPDFVVIDLVFAGCTAFQMLEHIKLVAKLEKVKVIVTSKHNSLSNVRSSIAAGASDYVIKPYQLEDMMGRMAFQIQKKKQYDSKKHKDDNGQAAFYFSYVDLMLKEMASDKDLMARAYNLTRMLSMTVKAVRISLIQCHEDRQRGVVRASSDDGKIRHLEINIARYPEVQYVLNTEKIVVLENLANDPMMSKIQSLVKTVSFNSMVVVPVFKNGEIYGVLSTRFDDKQQKIADMQIRFCEMLGNMMSMLVACEDSYGVKVKTSEVTTPDTNDQDPSVA